MNFIKVTFIIIYKIMEFTSKNLLLIKGKFIKGKFCFIFFLNII